jgi:uncharacterized protein
MKYLILFPLYLYRFIVSPFLVSILGHGCRFTPTCSEYSIAVIKKYGILKGIALSLRRFSKCQPWSKTHFDPIP